MSEANRVYRKDYREPDFQCSTVSLEFYLEEGKTAVVARCLYQRLAGSDARELVLNGENLDLQSVEIDGVALVASAYELSDEFLRLRALPESFELRTVVFIVPEQNLTLSGLYKSSGNYCTQCEAEGFRRISYFQDRPDILSKYQVRIEADKERYPVLLSNGNRVEAGESADGKHWVVWEDPFPKPSYLFALVAGDLRCNSRSFVTRSNREVSLEIWVNAEDLSKTDFALSSLQNAMKWDEEIYGLEYDLDTYMIVAVPDFNMGAMENKGLNIFNTKYVLANPQIANDQDFEGVDSVIAHEYFHNWTGNRVTCRDWFQLTLKEGLTVFRDQQYTSDQASAAVKRIGDVAGLRSSQFAEDAGPMSHPIRPESCVVMDNFYTDTVYEKGAEVIRMYHTLLGDDGFKQGLKLYLKRHDGRAATCDDFRTAMEDANEVELSQFERWYDQAGTPILKVETDYLEGQGALHIQLRQEAISEKHLPFHIPVRVGILDPRGRAIESIYDGVEAEEHLVELKDKQTVFRFEGVRQKPIVSLMRGFSAPVKVEWERPMDELALLMRCDSDPFNRWDAGQVFAKRLLLDQIAHGNVETSLESKFFDAFEGVLNDDLIDGRFKAMALALPSVGEIANELKLIDPEALCLAQMGLRKRLALRFRERFESMYIDLKVATDYRYEPAGVNRRALLNRLLGYIGSIGDSASIDLLWEQFNSANNMNDRENALYLLCNHNCPQRDQALYQFYEKWKGEALVVDKWFAIQAVSESADTFDRVRALTRHPDFNELNPNRMNRLVGSFAFSNLQHFHRADGRGYELVADYALLVQRANPQLGAHLAAAFNQWKRYDTGRQGLMRAQLERIEAKDGLSRDVLEIVSQALS